MKRHTRNDRGFTLIEMLIVVALIGILATIAVGQYQRSIVRAKEAALRENLFVMRSQINNYFADKGEYPFDLQTLVEEDYLKLIPKDRDVTWWGGSSPCSRPKCCW